MKSNGSVEEEVRKLVLPNALLLGQVRDLIREGHTATINVKGYSMRPFLEHCRDKVVLAGADTLRMGDAVLAEISEGVYVLHRIIDIDGDALTLMGDGNLKGVEHCCRKDVVGIVTHYIHFGKNIPASDKRLCRRIRLWRKLLPVRRYLLIIYKVRLKIRNVIVR